MSCADLGGALPCNVTVCDWPAPNVPLLVPLLGLLTETLLGSLVTPIQSSGCPPGLLNVMGGQRPRAQQLQRRDDNAGRD